MVFLVLPDPTVTNIVPTDQRIQHAIVAPFVFAENTNTNIDQHGIDMLVPAASWSQTEIKENGIVVSNSTYTVNSSVYFPEWNHIRKNLSNSDVTIEVTCPGGFLAYISGSGSVESYAFTAGTGAFNLQNYFTIQEKGTAIDTYYENTTALTHTFETTDNIVVKRTVESSFTAVTWLINGEPYLITENSNNTNTLNFPASALIRGENSLTMSVRYSGATQDSLYTGKVWLEQSTSFYANNVHYENLPDTTFCDKQVYFQAEVAGFNATQDSIKWFFDGVEDEAGRNLLQWSKTFEPGAHTVPVTMWVRFQNGEIISVPSTLNVRVFWTSVKNVRH